MVNWNKYPFLRLLWPFALGIWCCASIAVFKISFPVLHLTMIALFAISGAASALLKDYRLNWLFGLVMCCYLFFAGYALVRVHDTSVQKNYFRNVEANTSYYVARVYDCPTEKEKSYKTILSMAYACNDSLPPQAVSGKIICYFQKTDSVFPLRYGDMIIFPAPVPEVPLPTNPDAFNYHDYLFRKGITGQLYLKDTDWSAIGESKANPIYVFSYRIRDVLLDALQRCGLHDDEFGVAAAILLGYDDSLSDEMRQNYIAAGSMHVLCVSGMHVGIIYLIASFLLSFLNRKRWQKMLKHLLLLFLIWFYALIAGLSPSILRSSLMISFVIIGEMLHRKGFALNSIAASAFILLCINPNNLFEIGFLLSYIAVVGIVVLQKPIYGLIYIPNKRLDKVWEITSVALAAQIATSPITIYYFHQFSTYFWLSNLFMTPISFVVILGGMILLAVSWIPYVNVIFGYAVWGTLFVMNKGIAWIESLPMSIIKGLYINGLEFTFAMLFLLILLLFVCNRKKRYVFEMSGLALFFMISFTVRHFDAIKNDSMTVYDLKSHTVVDFVHGREHVMLADTALIADQPALSYSVAGNWLRRGLSSTPETIGLEDDFEGDFVLKQDDLISFDGKLLALWSDDYRVADSLEYRAKIDYLLVTGKQKPDIQSIVNCYKVGLLLIDGSVPSYLAEKWIAQAETNGIACHNVADGAFICNSD